MNTRVGPSPAALAGVTALALAGFAANSLLCRAAFATHASDPVSFTSIRLAAGAVTLVALHVFVTRRRRNPGRQALSVDWIAALELFAYALGFSLAYVRIPTGLGALLLFGSVQVTMIGGGALHGERLRPQAWAGISLAMAGLIALGLPGEITPDLGGVASMILAGVAWAAYSLRGRTTAEPIASTTGNFVGAAILALTATPFLATDVALTHTGVTLAVASGSLASALGYCLWYAVVPHYSAAGAGLLQLLVPITAAGGGTLLLGEPVTARLLMAGALVVCGVALAVRDATAATSAPCSAASEPRCPAVASDTPASTSGSAKWECAGHPVTSRASTASRIGS